jgi:hypothetical protein
MELKKYEKAKERSQSTWRRGRQLREGPVNKIEEFQVSVFTLALPQQTFLCPALSSGRIRMRDNSQTNLALQKLQARSSPGRNVAQLLLLLRLRNERSGVTSTDDDGRTLLARLHSRVKEGLGSTGESRELKDTGGTVPEDGLSLEDGGLEELAGLGSSVEAHPAVGDTRLVGGGRGLGFVEGMGVV